MSIEDTYEKLWANAPEPFNPSYHPEVKETMERLCEELERQGLYDLLSKRECASVIMIRYKKEFPDATIDGQ